MHENAAPMTATTPTHGATLSPAKFARKQQ